jgi:hypothetical protein
MGQVLGFGVTAELAQPRDQAPGSLCYAMCHGAAGYLLPVRRDIDFDQLCPFADHMVSGGCRLP